MCIPVHISLMICVSPPIWLPVICVSPTPSPPNKCLFCFCHFFLQNSCSIPFRLKETKGRRFFNAWKLLSSMHILYCLHAVPLYRSSSLLYRSSMYRCIEVLYRCIEAQCCPHCRPQCGQHSHPFVSISLSDTVVLLVVSNDCNCGTFL